jgi:hypothetical protein
MRTKRFGDMLEDVATNVECLLLEAVAPAFEEGLKREPGVVVLEDRAPMRVRWASGDRPSDGDD